LAGVLFVAAFAFLLASFPARNSDLWLHLAAGRQLVQDPGSFSTTARETANPWVYPAWLFDLTCFLIYSAVGGAGLVFCKALLVAGLALFLFRFSQTTSAGWVAAFCTALALLTMSTRLLLQPATVSYFGLALAFALALRTPGRPGEGTCPPSIRGRLASPWLPSWELVVLFVVWVNLDRWFVLGLATLALVWLGKGLDTLGAGASADGNREPRGGESLAAAASRLGILAGVCLLNPAGWYAFVPPPELGWFGQAESSALALASRQIMSPFQEAYFSRSLGLTPAGLAYFPLLVLGLLSFGLLWWASRGRWHWQRFLPWLGLALVSAFQVRAAPFFAVVAGPVLAWNLQDWLARQWAEAPQPTTRRRRILQALRPLAAVLSLAALLCAWPGWLQTPPFEPRRWAVETSPSLASGAVTTKLWHEEGKLGPEGRGLHLSPETANAFAWFCPEEKGVLDDGLAAVFWGSPGAPKDWAERMRQAGIDHLIVYDPNWKRLLAPLEWLIADPGQWPLLYLEGGLAVFGWRDPARPGAADRFRGQELDLNRQAFRPPEGKEAPRDRPDLEAEPRYWWEALWKPAPTRSLDREEAALYLVLAKAARRWAPRQHQDAWEASQAAAMVGAAGGWTGPAGVLDAQLRRVLFRPRLPKPGSRLSTSMQLDLRALMLQRPFALLRDDVPPGLLYLGVRAARRAIAAQPEDARAYQYLGECYLRLLHYTREHVWERNLTELGDLRRVQASVALNRAIALDPDLADARRLLSMLYQEMGYLDLALKHMRAYHRLFLKAGPAPGLSPEQFQALEEYNEKALSRLAEAVEAGEKKYQAEAPRFRVLDRALLARRVGLAGKARDLLLESDIAAFGPRGMALELDLLLRTGRARDVREWTVPEHQAELGPSYHLLRAQALAAEGDYALAEQELAELEMGGRRPGMPGPREAIAVLVGQGILDGVPGSVSVGHQAWRGMFRSEFRKLIAGSARRLRQEADTAVLRGLLALEEGEPGEAEKAFRAALALWKNEAAAASGKGLDFNGRPVAEACLGWLKK
jgi:hypothetical protein